MGLVGLAVKGFGKALKENDVKGILKANARVVTGLGAVLTIDKGMDDRTKKRFKKKKKD